MWKYNRPILYAVILLRNYVKWLEDKSDKSDQMGFFAEKSSIKWAFWFVFNLSLPFPFTLFLY
jgi:hypothetical protein